MPSEASDRFLRQSMGSQRMVRVEIDTGILLGYVTSFDETAIILLAKFTVGDTKEMQSALCMVPRTKVVIYVDQTVIDESEEFQEIYHKAREAR